MFSTTLDVRSLSELEGRWTQQASVVLGVCTRFTLPDLQSKHGSLLSIVIDGLIADNIRDGLSIERTRVVC